MRSILIVSTLCCLVAPGSLAAAEWHYQVNDKRLAIPPPAGFVRVTDGMAEVQRVMRELRDPLNEEIASYIDERDTELALGGGLPPLDYGCMIQMAREVPDLEFNKQDFIELRKQVVEENNQIRNDVRTQVRQYEMRMGQHPSNDIDIGNALQVAGMLPLPLHREDTDAFAFTMYMDSSAVMPDVEESFTVAMTTTTANVAGTVLFFYVYAPEEDLEWTRTASREWVDQVLAQNDAPPAQSSIFGLKSDTGSYAGLIVAIAAGVVIFLLRRHRR